MQPPVDTLRKILDLERRQGFGDRAVIGGLAALLERWRAESSGVPAAVADAVEALGGYASLTPDERRGRVAVVMAAIDSSAPVPGGGRRPAEAEPEREVDPPADRSRPAAEAAGDPAPQGSPTATARTEDGTRRTRLAPVDAGATARARPAAPRAPAPDSRAATPDSRAATPDSRAAGPEARAAGPEARAAAPEARPSRPRSSAPDVPPDLDAPVTNLRGVGATTGEQLARLGIHTVRDLLYHVPSRYNDFSRMRTISQLRAGETVTMVGTVWDVRERRVSGNRHVLTAILADSTGTIACTFFNQPFLSRELRLGRRLVVSGRVEPWAGRLTFTSPEWEPVEGEGLHTGRLVPVYPLTAGVAQRWLRRQIRSAVESCAGALVEPLPDDLREAYGLLDLARAVRELHSPADEEALSAARRRLAFDELLALQIWLLQRRRASRARRAPDLSGGRSAAEALVAGLAFEPTGAQRRAVDEILADLSAPAPMSRLLQGDVGSGKTVVAAAAIAACVAAGHQAALMVPTEILAEQHTRSLERMLSTLGFSVFDPSASLEPGGRPSLARLVGSLRPKEKAAVSAALAAGEVDVVVGTHAVIQSTVSFRSLGLAVVDEQHRFGVLQRAALSVGPADAAEDDAAPRPHVLIMTATPIPRTLAQVTTADLDQTVIDEMPPGRQPVRTLWLRPAERERAYQFIRHRVGNGEQAFIVCPRVEEGEDEGARAAVAEHARLANEVFPDLRLGLLHGRMRPAEKEAAMSAFRGGEVDVLVATSVIEVGVDVPNATVILVEGADRFGLAQLHQFRGRVGRGEAASTCLLLADDPSPGAADRLEALTSTNDGLALAERDLALRGPGDYFGVEQSGVVDRFRFARHAPMETLAEAREAAERVLGTDPYLASPAMAGLAALVAAFEQGAERI